MSKEAMELALEALSISTSSVEWVEEVQDAAISALQEALAQPEPFAPDWVNYRQGKIEGALEGHEWVGLTEEDVFQAWVGTKGDVLQRLRPFGLNIEAQLKEKNT